MPEAVSGAASVPGGFRRGDDELAPGDFLIEGEELHHRNNRGWGYWITYCAETEEASVVRLRVTSAIKTALKSQGMGIDYLKGAGDVAAAIRALHGVRAGMSINHTT